MKNRLIYVELKSGYSGNGPAWVSIAGASKTGATVYSNGKAFRSLKGSGFSANYYDIETGEEYWISGIKKNNEDRHWVGGGEILIDRTAVKTYLETTGFQQLPSNFIEVDLEPSTQQPQHQELEHEIYVPEQKEQIIPQSRSEYIKQK